jgi:hypothetical protein
MYYKGPNKPLISLLIFWLAMALPASTPILVLSAGGSDQIIALLYTNMTLGISWALSRLRFRLRILIGTLGWI